MKLKHYIAIGEKFGRLTVISQIENDYQGQRRFICQCSCGKERPYRAYSLYSGRAKSCGCLHKEKVSKHGDYGTRLYNIWIGMKARCSQASMQSFRYYGARGIKVCKKWKDFSVFRTWALENGYSDHLSIDRINPDDGYYPKNCRWATREIQDYNKRNTLFHNGTPLKKLCLETGVSYNRVWTRINRDGWDIEKALNTPPLSKKAKGIR